MSYNGSSGAGHAGFVDADTSKRKGMSCLQTRDGRVYMHVSFAATLSTQKCAFMCVVALLLLGYLFAEGVGSDRAVALHRRVKYLEHALARRVSWVYKHRDHLRQHISGDTDASGAPVAAGLSAPRVQPGERHADGRKHLLVAPGERSRLAQALGSNTGLHSFDDHYLCGEQEMSEEDVARKTIALAAITWRAPLSLRHSMESWRSNGLLDIVDERMLFINSPTEADYAIAREYDFDVYVTDERRGNIMAGPSLAYLVGNSSADYILMMEKDFALSAPRDEMMREMYTGVQHLARGVQVYRLRGKSDHPAEGMPDCCAKADPPTCPFHSEWKSAGYFSDHMNWLFIYCDPDIMEHSNGRLAHCTRGPAAPDSYCYTSGETNWSNNPAMFPRDWFHEHFRSVALMDFERNNMFEFNMMMHWLPEFWKVCSSFRGIFKHHEVDQ